jgi:hypothetical protein
MLAGFFLGRNASMAVHQSRRRISSVMQDPENKTPLEGPDPFGSSTAPKPKKREPARDLVVAFGPVERDNKSRVATIKILLEHVTRHGRSKASLPNGAVLVVLNRRPCWMQRSARCQAHPRITVRRKSSAWDGES